MDKTTPPGFQWHQASGKLVSQPIATHLTSSQSQLWANALIACLVGSIGKHTADFPSAVQKKQTVLGIPHQGQDATESPLQFHSTSTRLNSWIWWCKAGLVSAPSVSCPWCKQGILVSQAAHTPIIHEMRTGSTKNSYLAVPWRININFTKSQIESRGGANTSQLILEASIYYLDTKTRDHSKERKTTDQYFLQTWM